MAKVTLNSSDFVLTLFPSRYVYDQLKSEKYTHEMRYCSSPDFLQDLDQSDANKYIWSCIECMSKGFDASLIIEFRLRMNDYFKSKGDDTSDLDKDLWCIKKAFSIAEMLWSDEIQDMIEESLCL